MDKSPATQTLSKEILHHKLSENEHEDGEKDQTQITAGN